MASLNNSGKNLAGTNFRGQSLVRVNFRNAVLIGTDFSGCDLRSADFRGADLREANFKDARMGQAAAEHRAVALTASFAGFLLCLMSSRYIAGFSHAAVLRDGSLADQINYNSAAMSAMTTLVVSGVYGYQRKTLVAAGLASSVAVAVAVAGGGSGAGALIVGAAVAGAGACAVAVGGAGAGGSAWVVLAAAVVALLVLSPAVSFAIAVATVVAVALAQIHIIWRVRKRDERFALITSAGIQMRAWFGTRFDGANLTEANFAGARLAAANFSHANLTRVNWRGSSGLAESIHPGSILQQPAVRDLLTTGVGHNQSFARLDLHGANLADADLSGANLKEANCAGATFAGADLTGACIESWNIDATTDLKDVKCAEIFLLEQPGRSTRFSKRRPADANRDFAAGEFEQIYQKILDEMEILLKKGLSPEAMREAFNTLHEQHPGVDVRKFEDRGEHVVVGVAYPAGTDEGSVERVLRESWDAKLLLAEAQIQARLLESHYHDMKEVALAAAASAQSMQIGDQFVQDKSIRGNVISNSQLTTGDGNRVVQSLRQTGAAAGAADLATVLEQLLQKINAANELGTMEKHEAKQAVETVAVAAQAPQQVPSQKAASKAFETLTGLLTKVPDVTKLLEAATKAWEVVQKAVG